MRKKGEELKESKDRVRDRKQLSIVRGIGGGSDDTCRKNYQMKNLGKGVRNELAQQEARGEGRGY